MGTNYFKLFDWDCLLFKISVGSLGLLFVIAAACGLLDSFSAN